MFDTGVAKQSANLHNCSRGRVVFISNEFRIIVRMHYRIICTTLLRRAPPGDCCFCCVDRYQKSTVLYHAKIEGKLPMRTFFLVMFSLPKLITLFIKLSYNSIAATSGKSFIAMS